jgi:hypothetical protein
MSERDYLIAKAGRNMEEWKEGRRRASKDPAFLAGAGAGFGGAGVMGHTLMRNADKVNAGEREARLAGKTGFGAMKGGLSKLPKRFWVAGGTSVAGSATMQQRNIKHQRDIRRERV